VVWAAFSKAKRGESKAMRRPLLKKICAPIRWKGRDAVRISNGIVELISLNGGGHLAEFRFMDGNGSSTQNVLWEAPWTTLDPDQDWSPEMSKIYGPYETGKFLAGFTGHALCLDYFGDPPGDKAAAGLSIHGEAAVVHWNAISCDDSPRAQCRWKVSLPISGLEFEREIELGNGQSVAYIRETVYNPGEVEHQCDWVEHVTFGPLFLDADASTLFASGKSGMTSPLGYEGKSLLPDDLYFSWPYAQWQAGHAADLRLPFTGKGSGFLAGITLDPERQFEYLLAVNWKLRLGVGYSFRRRDFPWMTIWEENCARQDAPWNGTTRARGMEFGTTPLPMAANGGLPGEEFADIPRGCRIAAHSTRTARYIMFLFKVPDEMRSIGNVETLCDALCIDDESGSVSLSIVASGCESFLA
jgi:hypothetical protein